MSRLKPVVLTLALCGSLLFVPAHATLVEESIDLRVTANGSAGPITLTGGDSASVAISVSIGEGAGTEDVDGWLIAHTPVGDFYFDPALNTFIPGDQPSYQGPLFEIGELQVFAMSGLPDGVYTVRLGVDPRDGVLDERDFIFAPAKVNVSSAPVPGDVVEQNTVLAGFMDDVYFWREELPVVDPARYPSPEGLLEHLCFDRRDRFSFIANAEALSDFFDLGRFIGVGLFLRFDADDNLRIAQVEPISPAAGAGLERGERVLSVNGLPVGEIDSFNTAFGPDEVGVVVTRMVEGLDGAIREVDLVKEWSP